MTRVGWKLLTHANLSKESKEQICLILRPKGRAVIGTVNELNRLAFEINNGEISSVIPFDNSLTMYHMIDPPSPRSWSQGEKQLSLSV